mgnify:CR=1 FL=1
MAVIKRNTDTPEGSKALRRALNRKHDGRILDNLGGLFGDGVDDNVKQDGDKILGHILGDKKQSIEGFIVEKHELDAISVPNILKITAPVLIGVLGKQKQQNNVSSPKDLSGMLGGLLGGNDPQEEQSFLEKILDADGGGSIIDDVTGMLLG